MLGESDELMRLAIAVCQSNEHTLAACFECPSRVERLSDYAPATRFDLQWETLLHASDCDGVMVDGQALPCPGSQHLGSQHPGSQHPGQHESPDRRADQLRRLVQAGVPVLIIHPVSDALLAFELDMIRQDNHCVVVPYHAHHPALDDLAQLLCEGDSAVIGAAQQLTFQRPMLGREKRDVIRQLAHDVSWIRFVSGIVRKISAVGTWNGSNAANLNVSMTCASGCIANWSMEPGTGGGEASMSLVGTSGTAALMMPEDPQLWRMDFRSETDVASRTYEESDIAASALARFLEEMSRADSSSWLEACHDIDAAELVQDSMRRGKTIELLREQRTEGGNFKGVMAMGSCGLLLFVFFGLLFVAVLDSVLLPSGNHRFLFSWPVLILVPLLSLLLLQLLQFVVPRRPQPSDEGTTFD